MAKRSIDTLGGVVKSEGYTSARPPLPASLANPCAGSPATPAQLRVWELLRYRAAGERVDLSVRALAAEAGVSPMTAWRALRRFHALGLVKLLPPRVRGRGYTLAIEMVWRPGGPSPKSLLPAEEKTKGKAADCLVGKPDADEMYHPLNPHGKENKHGHSDHPGPPDLTPLTPQQALRLAMAKVRAEVQRWPTTWERRNRVLTGVGAALHRVLLQDGGPVPRGRVLALVDLLLARLGQGEDVGRSLKRACSYAGWLVAWAWPESRRLMHFKAAQLAATEQIAARRRELLAALRQRLAAGTLCRAAQKWLDCWAPAAYIAPGAGTG